MKFLITGGAGFIGSAVIRYLIKSTQHQVLNVDKLTYAGNLESLKEISSSSRYKFAKVDICDKKSMSEHINSFAPDIIMHLAAESHVDRSIDGPSEFIETNIIGTYTLLEVTRDYVNRNKLGSSFIFHHISTDEVFGDLPHPNESSFLPLFTERTPYSPSSPYSASKAASDHLVRAWNRTFNLNTIVTNCSNNYGPYHFPEKLIPLTILNALYCRPLPVYGDGSQIRDWLFVEDHAKALVKVATSGLVGETFNIGGHNEVANIDVVNLICDIMDELKPIENNSSNKSGLKKYSDLITFVNDRPGHDKRYAIDATKIKKTLGWAPDHTFEQGIRSTVKWYLNNKDWWAPIVNDKSVVSRKGNIG